MSSTTWARTSLVCRSLSPTTAVLPTGPRPVSCFRFWLLIFRRLPPKYDSSASTGPKNRIVGSSFQVSPNPVNQVPCRLLSDAKITMQFHTGDTLQVSRDDIDGIEPAPAPKFGASHGRPRS